MYYGEGVVFDQVSGEIPGDFVLDGAIDEQEGAVDAKNGFIDPGELGEEAAQIVASANGIGNGDQPVTPERVVVVEDNSLPH
jgi:hypothetical protein